MMKMSGFQSSVFLLALFVIGSAGNLSAGEVFSGIRYVDVDGDDSNPGTAGAPWATVQHAVDRAGPGATIRLGPGVFREQVVVRRSGAADAPITIEGTRGENGERLSRVDAGQDVPPDTWEPAPEIGPNVYKNESFDYEPQILTVDGKFLAHAHRSKDGSLFPYVDAMELLSWPEDYQVSTMYISRRHEVAVPFWEATGGVYAHHPDPDRGITYLRLAEGVQPNDPRQRDDIAVSDGGAVVAIENVSHIVLRGLEITRGNIGVQVHGSEARHNLIDDCFISHGRKRIDITSRAAHTTVRNSHLAMGFFGARPGAWAGGDDIEAATNDFLYNFFKYMHGRGTSSDDRGVHVRGDSSYTTIENNHIDGGLIGVGATSNHGLIVRNNLIHDFSSVGLVIDRGTIDAAYYGNVVYNCSINVRLHNFNAPRGGHRVKIYRNRFFQPGRVGNHTYVHALEDVEDYPEPEVVYYHNTFVGGGQVYNHNPRMDVTPRVHFINNVIATDRQPFSGRAEYMQNPDGLGTFAYNWVGGAFSASSPPAWFGSHNIVGEGEHPWSRESLPSFRLPVDHPARGSGIDISKPFTIDGRSFDSLPGMKTGYYDGSRPDMGAIQHGVDQ